MLVPSSLYHGTVDAPTNIIKRALIKEWDVWIDDIARFGIMKLDVDEDQLENHLRPSSNESLYGDYEEYCNERC